VRIRAPAPQLIRSVGPIEEQDQESPMISPRPSRTFETSSGDACAMRRPILSTANVRIWLILIQERLGRPRALLSSVSGNPARGSWLVRATAITVPERSLKTSWLRMSTGRSPACSRPRTGLRSAQRTSPLSIRAKSLYSRPALPRPELSPHLGPASHIRAPSDPSPGVRASRQQRLPLPGFDSRSGAWIQAGPVRSPMRYRG